MDCFNVFNNCDEVEEVIKISDTGWQRLRNAINSLKKPIKYMITQVRK